MKGKRLFSAAATAEVAAKLKRDAPTPWVAARFVHEEKVKRARAAVDLPEGEELDALMAAAEKLHEAPSAGPATKGGAAQP